MRGSMVTYPATGASGIKLEILSLPFNRLSGALPLELGRLASLQVLDLSRNAISGGIPPQLGDLRSLRLLDLLKLSWLLRELA